MERLEGGLEKLKSTAAQVDDLKEKLAAQEVELKQKNEDADALIKKVTKSGPFNKMLRLYIRYSSKHSLKERRDYENNQTQSDFEILATFSQLYGFYTHGICVVGGC